MPYASGVVLLGLMRKGSVKPSKLSTYKAKFLKKKNFTEKNCNKFSGTKQIMFFPFL